ncbi:hypothetical protein [Longimicrobium terrae]|uniref:Restriction endonuclease type IV Mrr domain-containing protein n=1 Tax=Longimicrobium terrae TaxID=1639882 RepID=A0A841H2L9_9BACT|nr:hypothetical protein [Longimicrobium terrae]MBB4637987.1 hypothetical protein [Longimicrobium terrae]MBB6072234.1 hypothetical protein [Longimicrobium terrae]NNC28345.1 hypothetical protein [Longimicrobium terrae]
MEARLARSTEQLATEAEEWTHADLIALWRRIQSGERIAGWGRGKVFEYLVIRAFQLEGAVIRWPFQVSYPQRFGTMEQHDGFVYVRDRAFLIESKATAEAPGIEAVAKLRFRLEARPPGTMGLLFSVATFSEPTEVFTQFASPLNVLLWTGKDVDLALRTGRMRSGLEQKLRFANEFGLSNYSFVRSQP